MKIGRITNLVIVIIATTILSTSCLTIPLQYNPTDQKSFDAIVAEFNKSSIDFSMLKADCAWDKMIETKPVKDLIVNKLASYHEADDVLGACRLLCAADDGAYEPYINGNQIGMSASFANWLLSSPQVTPVQIAEPNKNGYHDNNPDGFKSVNENIDGIVKSEEYALMGDFAVLIRSSYDSAVGLYSDDSLYYIFYKGATITFDSVSGDTPSASLLFLHYFENAKMVEIGDYALLRLTDNEQSDIKLIDLLDSPKKVIKMFQVNHFYEGDTSIIK